MRIIIGSFYIIATFKFIYYKFTGKKKNSLMYQTSRISVGISCYHLTGLENTIYKNVITKRTKRHKVFVTYT